MDEANWAKYRNLFKEYLKEDIGDRDVTTEELITQNRTINAELLVKETCCLSGLRVFEEIFKCLDNSVFFEPRYADGDIVQPGPVLRLVGNSWTILKGERTALNLISRLSGIATVTRKFADKVQGTDAKILDTRKTTPGMRLLEKEAVRHGGGHNHRFGLYDMVLIKDNHLKLLDKYTPDALKYMIDNIRRNYTKMLVEIEVEDIKQLDWVLPLKCDIILLDNMNTEQIKQCVALIGNQAEIEVSGGVNLDNVRQFAEIGVDRISIGALTHSCRGIDFSLEISNKTN